MSLKSSLSVKCCNGLVVRMVLILLFIALNFLPPGLSHLVSQCRGAHAEVRFLQPKRASQVRSSTIALFSSYKNKIYTSSTPDNTHSSGGRVSLVCSGPGDPDLLTVQAMKLIQEADLVVSDRLVSNDILNLVQGELKIATRSLGVEMAQEEIYRWVCEGVKGKNVVRLKIGDPYLFGRGGRRFYSSVSICRLNRSFQRQFRAHSRHLWPPVSLLRIGDCRIRFSLAQVMAKRGRM